MNKMLKDVNNLKECKINKCNDDKKYNKCVYNKCKKELITEVKSRLAYSIYIKKHVIKNYDENTAKIEKEINNLLKKKNKSDKDIKDLLILINKFNNPLSKRKVIIFRK